MEFGDDDDNNNSSNNNMFCYTATTTNITIRDQHNGNGFGGGWYSSWGAEPPSTHHHFTDADAPLYGGNGSHVHPDPHLTCLKLGKRHYFEDSNSNLNLAGDSNSNLNLVGDRHVSVGREKASVVVARCQVEGCHVALVNAKEYHRRHKVCEMHSKAAKVVVLGRDQRFCQQCSRFHVVSEFDDSKRSCRRRLAGHNQRRRKSSHHSVATNSALQAGCALSLLSPGSGSWLSHADLSIRCSAALHELIAENRAALVTRRRLPHLILDRDHRHHDNAVEQLESKEIIPHDDDIPPVVFHNNTYSPTHIN